MTGSAPSGPRAPRVEILGVTSTAITLGLVDGMTGVLGGRFEFSHLPRIVASIGFTALFFLPLAAMALAASRLAGRIFSRRSTSLYFGVAGTGICLFTLAALNGLIGIRLFGGEMVRIAFFTLISLVTGWAVGRATGETESSGHEESLVRWSLGVPSVLSISFLFFWWIKYQRQLSGMVMLVALILSGLAAFWLLFLIGKTRSRAVAYGLLSAIAGLIIAGALPLFLAPSPASAAGATGSGGPPIVLITIDTLRADALSAYGSEGADTPSIDSLAADGVRFTQAMSPAPWTLPSVASILTGLPPAVHGVRGAGKALPGEIRTLAERLKEAGYLTAAVGANPYLNGTRSLARGFDSYQMYGGSPPPRRNAHLGAILMRKLVPHLMERRGTTEEITDLAGEWIQRSHEGAFFLWIHYLDPHVPYEPPERYLAGRSRPEGLGNVFAKQSQIRSGFFVPTIPEREWIRSLYLAEVEYVDEALGTLLDGMKASGLYDKALIVLTSDHGEEFWEHGGYEHGHSLHDEVMHVPLIIKAPGSSPSGVSPTRVSIESTLPTILDLAGIECEEPYIRDRSLAPAVRDPGKVPEPRPVFGGEVLYYENQASVTLEGIKYIRWLVSGKEAIYDLQADPGEQQPMDPAGHVGAARAQGLMRESEAGWAALRSVLGGDELGEGVMDRETREQLRSLGYVQ